MFVVIKDFYVTKKNSESTLKGKKTLSQHRSFMSQQTQHKVEVNSVATKTSIIATKAEKNYKKNVATQKIMLPHNEELKIEIFVVTKRKLCHDRKWKRIEKIQDKFVVTKISMLQQTVQPTTKTKEGNMSRHLHSLSRHKVQSLNSARQQDYVTTKKRSIATTTTCNCEKLYHDKEKYVATKVEKNPINNVAT